MKLNHLATLHARRRMTLKTLRRFRLLLAIVLLVAFNTAFLWTAVVFKSKMSHHPTTSMKNVQRLFFKICQIIAYFFVQKQ
jgi:hypothetical protein